MIVAVLRAVTPERSRRGGAATTVVARVTSDVRTVNETIVEKKGGRTERV